MEIFEKAKSNTNIDKRELFTYIDNTVFNNETKRKIKGMLEVVLLNGDNDIHLEFSDLKMIMNLGAKAFSGIGEYEGENPATEAIKLSIKDSSLNYNLMDKVLGILIHFVIHPNLPVEKLTEAMEIIYKNAHDDAYIIWGTTTDKSVSANYVKTTILFTGF